MFSPEDVLFYKLMLESGCPELLDEALDAALKEEDPLSEVVLDLSCPPFPGTPGLVCPSLGSSLQHVSVELLLPVP